MPYSTTFDSSASLLHLTDDSAGLQAAIAPAHGAELSSLQLLFEGEYVETLYRANDFADPHHGWRGRAPLLWPAVGRNFTEEHLEELQDTGDYDGICSYVHEGATFQIPRHGFAMHRAWELKSYDADDAGTSATCTLGSTDETLVQYPFDFELSAQFLLSEGALSITYRVESRSDGLPFSIGNHLSFALPFSEDGSFEEVMIRGPIDRQQVTTKAGLFSGEALEIDLSQGARLADERLHNGVFGPVAPESASVAVWQEGAFGFRVSQRTLDATDAPLYFVFYAQPDDGLYCPEPWLGGPNSLNTRQGVVTLNAGESFSWQMILEPITV